MVGGTELVGQYAVVVINRGRSQGIEPGSVLAIDQAGDTVPDLYRGGPHHRVEHRHHLRPEGEAAG